MKSLFFLNDYNKFIIFGVKYFLIMVCDADTCSKQTTFNYKPCVTRWWMYADEIRYSLHGQCDKIRIR